MSTRNQRVIDSYKAGHTIEWIATSENVSKPRIHQILKRAGVTRADNPVTKSKSLTAYVGVNLSDADKQALQTIAAAENVSVSAFIYRLIQDDIRKRVTP